MHQFFIVPQLQVQDFGGGGFGKRKMMYAGG
jgi:hypothetical protein